jgi:hypothetical protein
MTEEEMRSEWAYLSGVPRIEGVPVSDDDRQREDRLLAGIRTYEANEDLSEYKRSKGLSDER